MTDKNVVDDVMQESPDPDVFMAVENIDRLELGVALREYRDIDSSYIHDSPWEDDALNTLTTDFINWFRWERL